MIPTPTKTLEEISTSYNDRKVYVVPLPDFTVYPRGLRDHRDDYLWILFTIFRIFLWPRKNVLEDTKAMSPFLRVINEEDDTEIYNTPSIIAVLAFKWSAARRHFIRHILVYLIYTVTFAISVLSYSFDRETRETLVDYRSSIPLTVNFILYVYSGWYLIATEIVQLKRAGWSGYFSLYNMFDVGSVLLPFAVNIAAVLNFSKVIEVKYSIYNTALAFTTLVMWFELVNWSYYFFIIAVFFNSLFYFILFTNFILFLFVVVIIIEIF